MSAAVKAGYKQTEVGVIPEDWEASAICEVFNITAGGDVDPKRSQSYPDEFHPYPIYSNALTNYGLYGYCSYADHPAGSITVTARGMVGAANFRDLAYTAIGRVLVLQPKREIAELYFSEVINNRVNFANESTGVPQLTAPQISKYQLPVPPLLEQRAIAEALSDVDALLGGLDRLIAKKRDLKQAAMQQLLTGQTRLPGFQGEWEVTRLGDVGKCLRGVSYRGDSDLSTHDTSHTKRLLRSNNVQNAIIVTDEVRFVNAERVSTHQMLKRDDILICMANGSKALVGKAGLFRVRDGHEYTFGAFMGCFRTDFVASNPTFVFYLFQTGRYRDYINNLLAGSSINNLSPSSIESLEFSTPPVPEQTAIAAVLSNMDADLSALVARREKTRALKQGMIQELLTGRTRLV
jgi:type I restriction enzyme S subunit